MKREAKKHLQKYCDVSNWSRMKKPKTGKANYEAGQAMAEEILSIMMSNEPGYDGTAIMLTALALVRSYVRKAICRSNAWDCNTRIHLLEKYEELFRSDGWMMAHHDMVMFEIAKFIKGNV